MSYTILYRSMFVKMSDGRFIPMVEMGDNNVWEAGNRRRARDWHQWHIGDRKAFPAYTREEIMADVERMINSEKRRVGQPYESYEHKDGCYTEQEIEKNFGYYSGIAIEGRHCNNTSAQMVRNFFMKGFEQAVSFDEDSDLKIELQWCTEYPHWERRHVSTEQELLKTWEELKEVKRDVWLDYYCCANWLYGQHRKKATKRETKEHTAGYTVTIDGHYILQATPRKFRYTYWLDCAHIYPQRATAEKLQQRIQRAGYSSEVRPVSKNANGKWEEAA